MRPCLRRSPLVLLLLPLASIANAAVYVVNPAGTGDFPTIQAAVNAASPGDIIELTDGTFTGFANCSVTFAGKAITVRSQSGNPDACIIDCGTSVAGFRFITGETPSARLQNVQIRRARGAGITCTGGSPTITGCVVRLSTAYASPSTPGRGIYVQNSSVQIGQCEIADNDDQGIYFGSASSGAVVDRCVISGNLDGVLCNLAGPTITSTTIAENGRGLNVTSNGFPNMDRCILAFNTISSISCGTGTATFACSDIFGNAGGNWISCISSQLGVNGNISVDPLFCPGGEYGLSSISPLLSAPGCGLVGARGVGCAPQTYVVNPAGTGDFPTIQAAVNASSPGDIIELTDGTFTGSANCNVDFAGKTITVRSQSGNPAGCVVDCGESFGGFRFVTGETSSTLLANVQIRRARGAGITCAGGSPTITGCVVRLSTASLTPSSAGRGVYVQNSSAQIGQCEIADNDDQGIYFGSATSGAVVDGCVISGNLEGILCNLAGPMITSTTIAENGRGVNVSSSGFPTLDRCVLAFNTISSISCGTGTATFTCSDIFGNAGGNWISCISSQFGVNGNVSVDPLFCLDSYSLRADSPLVDAPGCGQIGALGAACGGAAPVISSIVDVPNDQGRRVRASWLASFHDAAGTGTTITQYSVWRRIDTLVARGAGAEAPARLAFPPGDWDYVLSVPARGEAAYNVVVPTLCDSNAVALCYSTFFVSAMTPDPLVFFDSDPDSGYSVDNLSPAPPGNFRFVAPTDLAWDEASDPDVVTFLVYESSTADFGAATLFTSVPATQTKASVAGATGPFFFVTAKDYNGNEGAPSGPVNGATAAPGLAPVVQYSFSAGRPNPFSDASVFRLALPRSGPTSVTVYDVHGRLVRSLVDREMPKGRHDIAWEGTDVSGRRVPAGVYFLRVVSREFVATRKAVRVE